MPRAGKPESRNFGLRPGSGFFVTSRAQYLTRQDCGAEHGSTIPCIRFWFCCFIDNAFRLIAQWDVQSARHS